MRVSAVVIVRALGALLLVSLVSSQGRDRRFFHTGNFWNELDRRLSEANSMMQERLDSNVETAMDRLSVLGESIGSLSRRIQDQVQDNLPEWMVEDNQPIRRQSVSPKDAPIEAIMGTLGSDGLDDGLEVFFDGASNGEDRPEPHIIPKESVSSYWESEDFNTDSEPEDPSVSFDGFDGTGGPLFDRRIKFGNNHVPFQFPRLPSWGERSPSLWSLTRFQPWWRGENVCIDETEIDESEDDAPVATTEVSAPEETTPGGDIQQEVLVSDKLVERADEEDLEEAERDATSGRAFFFGFIEMKSCKEEREKYTCTNRIRKRGINRTVRTVYRCCHGYIRERSGCTKVDMVPLDESLEGLELTDFLSLLKRTGTVDMINSRNFTVFAPNNEAVIDFTTDLTERNDIDITDNEVYRKKRSASTDEEIKNIVYSHLHEGFLYTGDMQDEQIITSMKDDSSIRINIYKQEKSPVITANCAQMVTSNQHSSNGVIHTLDRVMQPATRNIAQIISQDSQFTHLNTLLKASGMLDELKEPGQLTLFAPTNAAFDALPPGKLESLLDGSSCLPALIKNHILPNVICSAAITNPEAKTINLLEKFLQLRMQFSGKLFVEDAQIVAKDIMGTNGVIHIIDAPLMPQEAKPVLEVLESQNLTRFLELLEVAELTRELEQLRDVAVFAPSNEAIDDLGDAALNELKGVPERLREMLRYHITSSPLNPQEVANNHIMDTQAGHPLRMNLYTGPTVLSLRTLLSPSSSRLRLTAGCGTVTLLDSRACGATVHVVDSMLEPAKHNIIEKLEQEPEFSIFHKMVKESSLAEELAHSGPHTVLAPSDHVFRTLPEQELESLLEDSELQEELIKRHILKEHVCCSGISPNMFPFRNNARTLHGSTVHMHQTPGGLLMAGSGRITRCDKPGQNGLVHTINRLYVEPHIPRTDASSPWETQDPLVIRFPGFKIFGRH